MKDQILLNIRLATEQDEPTVLELAAAFHLEDGHPLKASSPAAIRTLLSASPLGKIFLILQNEETIGYFALCFTMSLEFGGLVVILDDLYLRKEFRGSGLGTKILQEVESLAKKYSAVQVFLEVETQNKKALRLYERNGFKIRARHMLEKHL